MKLLDIFLADWLHRLLILGPTISLPTAIIWHTAIQPHLLDGLPWYDYIYLPLAAVILYAVVYMISALMLSVYVMLPISHVIERLNGGPFAVGDRVIILTGRYYGKKSVVYSLWQHGLPRVTIGHEEERNYRDIFSRNQLRRIRD